MANQGTLKVTLKKSPIKRKPDHRACIRGLGLKRIGHTVELEDTAAVRGMISKISYMLSVVEPA